MKIYESISVLFKKNTTVKKLSNLLNLSQSQLYRYAESPEDSGTRIPADMIPILTELTGNYVVIQNLAEACGCIAIPIKNLSVKKNTDFLKVIQSKLAATQKIVDANADGKISEDEIKEIKKAAFDSIIATSLYIKSLENKHE